MRFFIIATSRSLQLLLTLLDGQIGHGQGHRVPREDVVPAVDVLPVDGQAPSRQQGNHTPGHV